MSREWSSPKDGTFEWREDGKLLGTFFTDYARNVYVDDKGVMLSARFDHARQAIEKRAAGVEVEEKGQQKLAL